MKLNEIKYLPATNAVGKVYADATGMPFVGELMCAAAGNGGEPTPPTPSVVESVTVQMTDSLVCSITVDSIWFYEHLGNNPVLLYDVTLKNLNNEVILQNRAVAYEPTALTGVSTNEPIVLSETGEYEIQIKDVNESTLYEGTGTWTLVE